MGTSRQTQRYCSVWGLGLHETTVVVSPPGNKHSPQPSLATRELLSREGVSWGLKIKRAVSSEVAFFLFSFVCVSLCVTYHIYPQTDLKLCG